MCGTQASESGFHNGTLAGPAGFVMFFGRDVPREARMVEDAYKLLLGTHARYLSSCVSAST